MAMNLKRQSGGGGGALLYSAVNDIAGRGKALLFAYIFVSSSSSSPFFLLVLSPPPSPWHRLQVRPNRRKHATSHGQLLEKQMRQTSDALSRTPTLGALYTWRSGEGGGGLQCSHTRVYKGLLPFLPLLPLSLSLLLPLSSFSLSLSSSPL